MLENNDYFTPIPHFPNMLGCGKCKAEGGQGEELVEYVEAG